MLNKANEAEKQWEQNRSWLFNYVANNKTKQDLSQQIYDLISESTTKESKKAATNKSPKINHSHIKISGADILGLTEKDIAELLQSLPGNWVSSLSYTNNHAPARLAQSTGKQAHVFCSEEGDDLCEINIYDPINNHEGGCDILCHGCMHAHTTSHYPNKISKKMVDSINHSINNIDSHEFHATHKDRISKPGRSYYEAQSSEAAILWPTLVETAYEAPFYADEQDWKTATQQALMGMQFLNDSESAAIVEALDQYFTELDPGADMNSLIRSYQNQVKVLEFKILSNHIAELFQEMQDKGLKTFFNRWIKHLNQDSVTAEPTQRNFSHHTPSLRVGMALDDAKELGANLATSLRVESSNNKDKRKVLHDLRVSIRRFNDIWSDLDKKEQKSLRPKLLQIVHASIN